MTISRDVSIANEHRDLLEILVSNNKIFPTHKALICFSAFLGFSLHRRKELGKKYENPIKAHIFDSDNSSDYVYLIAVADQKNIEPLNNDTKIDYVKIFEEYANGGMYIIETWMKRYNDPCGIDAILSGMKDEGFIPKNEDLPTDLGTISFD